MQDYLNSASARMSAEYAKHDVRGAGKCYQSPYNPSIPVTSAQDVVNISKAKAKQEELNQIKKAQ
ncbi:MAG: hypothetical protein A2287_09565 [Candidatus Melainabacteria bacterium RIFOXYA12_FULL_32_12]|nr:MAG: hypothetical protein A2255_02535 [Candidatus Melainabacteria bacterium RIFOXYA2_FULL_32_9]OGI29134.1 MAG: hypothetical protein A2287_09565 [Candidatus Melainabacteria bacterium RIFOXYA12_FULL_32_12]